MAEPRTLVGSHPHRQTLPMGREAVERALHHLDAWLAEEPSLASERALAAVRFDTRARTDPDSFATWLPFEVKYKTREQLEAMLAEMRQP